MEARKELGHWEGDTMVGSDLHHCILTLVERKSGYLIIKKMSSRTTESVTQAAVQAIAEHRASFKTLTLDNGTEFHGYKALEKRFPIKCYFARPYHSWERGTNENTNGLIRQYIPKRTSMKWLTQERCDRIGAALNSRPRKRHGYITPHQVFCQENCTSTLNLSIPLFYLRQVSRHPASTIRPDCGYPMNFSTVTLKMLDSLSAVFLLMGRTPFSIFEICCRGSPPRALPSSVWVMFLFSR